MPLRLCEHLKADGHRCGSPAMRGHSRCYFHLRPRSAARPRRFLLPDLTNKNSISPALNQISQGMLDGSVDGKAFGHLIHAINTLVRIFNTESRLAASVPKDRG